MARIAICAGTLGDSEGFTTAGTISFSGGEVRVNPTTTGTGYIGLQTYGSTGGVTNWAAATIYARAYFKPATLPASGSEEILRVYDTASGNKLHLRVTSAGNLAAYDSANTLLATGTTALNTSTFYCIEVQCGTGASASYEVRINGATELSSSTANLGTTNNGFVRWGKPTNRSSQSVDFRYKWLAVDDAAWPGTGAMAVIVPNGNGTYNTVASGNYTDVDETANDGDTSYIATTGTVGNAYTATLQNCADVSISGTILSLRRTGIFKRDGASNGQVKVRMRSNSTDTDSAAFSSTSAYAFRSFINETNPNTAAAWTTGEIDALEIGMVNDSANASRMTATFAIVEDRAGGFNPSWVVAANLTLGASGVLA